MTEQTIAGVFFVYVLVMLGIGWATSRQTQSPLDFFLADRSLNAWVTAISSTASSESAWSGLGTSFGPLILFTLYWKKTTQQGAIAGMLTGFVTTLVWKTTGLSDSVIYERVPAFILSSLEIYFVSKTTKVSDLG